ncbi:MAG: hypothetical protein SGI84_02000 [Gemmatimonadota bacterium]|nr:hypothetical protein [Gemmatimonadota bacterium]
MGSLRWFGLVVVLAGCGPVEIPPRAPAELVGEWVDDYGIRYQVSDTLWLQQPSVVYRVARWEAGEQYLVAQNGAENPADGGLYTRIDWVELEAAAPWDWAFCMATWDANSSAGAAVAPASDREHPRTGCDGHPFSRMRRVTADSLALPGRGYR